MTTLTKEFLHRGKPLLGLKLAVALEVRGPVLPDFLLVNQIAHLNHIEWDRVGWIVQSEHNIIMACHLVRRVRRGLALSASPRSQARFAGSLRSC